jgi:hypothetical protein
MDLRFFPKFNWGNIARSAITAGNGRSIRVSCTFIHTRDWKDPRCKWVHFGILVNSMADALIENPILNSPFLEPTRHFKFTDEGITNEVVAGRRSSSYFIPIARPKKKGPPQQNLWVRFGWGS